MSCAALVMAQIWIAVYLVLLLEVLIVPVLMIVIEIQVSHFL